MPRIEDKICEGKIVAVHLSTSMIKRLRYHATQTDQTLRAVVTSALDAALPKDIQIVVGSKESRRASK